MSGEKENRWQIRIVHIRDEVSHILNFVEGMTLEEFQNDPKTLHAVTRAFQVMGEASKLVPNEIRDRYTEIDWKHMAKFRDVLVHDYDGIDTQMTWSIIKDELPRLANEIKKIPLNKDK